jgi:putative ABC transport system permease protein
MGFHLDGWTSLERLAQDVRHAGRTLRRDRFFTAVAILVLALGIGGNTTVFSLINALVLNPFPYPGADRLVEIKYRADGGSGSLLATVPLPDFAYWRTEIPAFESIGTYGWSRANLTGQSLPGFEEPEQIVTGTATEAFLRVLGVQPALGRFFMESEDRPGGPPVVVLSHGAWMRRFGGTRDVLGQTLTLNGRVHTIIGVMPARLPLPGSFTCEVWRAAAYDIATNMQPGYNTRYDGDHVVARLKPDVRLAQAQEQIDLVGGRIAHQRPDRKGRREAVLVRLGSDIARDEGNRLRLLGLIVGTGLLLACLNLAGLLLARNAARTKELAVRAALGAGRGRLVRYVLSETLLLGVCGGVLGAALAAWTIGLIGAAAPPFMGLDSAVRIDGTVLGFALGVSLLTGLVFGLVPALHGSKTEVTTALKGIRSSGHGLRRGRILSALVVAEVSLALLLLVGGALLTTSFVHLLRVDTGIRAEGLLTFRVSLAGPRYSAEAARSQFFGTLLDRLRAVPDITSAGAVNPLPMSREYSGGGFTIEGRPAPANWRDMATQYCQATPEYFRTMGIPVVLGREFAPSDAGQPVVLINNALARRFFPGASPLGHRIARFGTIVGVVGDVRHNGPASEPGPQLYYPAASRPGRTMSIAVRTAGDPLTLAAVVRQQVHGLDADLPVDRLKPMTTVITEATADVRIITALVAGFAVFALALAAIGMYGVIAYSVSQRRHEIGIRFALGASRGSVVGLVLGRGALLAFTGIVIGVPLALAAVRLTAAFLFGVSPRDAAVFAAVPTLVLAVALFASYLPARATTKINPLDALRSE